MTQVIKKDGTKFPFDKQKIIKAVSKSAERVLVELTNEENEAICKEVENYIESKELEEVEGTVINSVIGSKVTIEEGAIVKDSVIFSNTIIKKGAVINYSIIDVADGERPYNDGCPEEHPLVDGEERILRQHIFQVP